MKTKVFVAWFRKGLRVHDNPSLSYLFEQVAKTKDSVLLPVFILDPHFVKQSNMGLNRWMFLLQCLEDLKGSLQQLGTDLIVLRGDPVQIFKKLFSSHPSEIRGEGEGSSWAINEISFESDTEPYSRARDAEIEELCLGADVSLRSFVSHTLFDPKLVIQKNGGKTPQTYQSFCKIVEQLLPLNPAVDVPTPLKDNQKQVLSKFVVSFPQNWAGNANNLQQRFHVPTLSEIISGSKARDSWDPQSKGSIHVGGEKEALVRLERYMSDTGKVCTFEKPNTSPAAFSPASTTVLSPYLTIGALSPRIFYHRLQQEYKKRSHSKPPVSLLGQLYWREFFYCCGYGIENFDTMKGNPICYQIDWRLGSSDDTEARALEDLRKWEMSETGYPWIDAIMTQLRQEGWMHHLARHSVACFLTRGDLYISWERGAQVFEKYLIDADWSLNSGNWQWLSASAFFHQYFRVYSPVAFPKKYDSNGDYVRRYIPKLANFPAKYIYEPWKAPIADQKKAQCIIGVDYPKPIVDHDIVSKANIGRMKAAYDKRNKSINTKKGKKRPIEDDE